VFRGIQLNGLVKLYLKFNVSFYVSHICVSFASTKGTPVRSMPQDFLRCTFTNMAVEFVRCVINEHMFCRPITTMQRQCMVVQ
jgi:hypothetical protein